MSLAEEDKTDRLAVSLGLPLGVEAPVMMPNGVVFFFLARSSQTLERDTKQDDCAIMTFSACTQSMQAFAGAPGFVP